MNINNNGSTNRFGGNSQEWGQNEVAGIPSGSVNSHAPHREELPKINQHNFDEHRKNYVIKATNGGSNLGEVRREKEAWAAKYLKEYSDTVTKEFHFPIGEVSARVSSPVYKKIEGGGK
jgi:hypothetical protein